MNSEKNAAIAAVRPRIAVAEDATVVRRLIGRMLSRLGFDVIEAADGEQALDICRAGAADVMLLDWKMPGMDGLEVLRILAQEGWQSALPKIVFCAASHNFETVWRALDLGADEYIMKPFDDYQLISKLKLVGIELPAVPGASAAQCA